jgi:anti-sigma regulatory factor (Ser/Thr protein kinase)
MRERYDELVCLDLPCDSDAPGTVRRALEEADGVGPMMGDVMLVASELVTNAVRHSGCTPLQTVRVDAGLGAQRVRISICDPGASGRSAQTRRPGDLGDGGMGLMIVDQLADSWGTERGPGYCVWAEMSLTEAIPA